LTKPGGGGDAAAAPKSGGSTRVGSGEAVGGSTEHQRRCDQIGGRGQFFGNAACIRQERTLVRELLLLADERVQFG